VIHTIHQVITNFSLRDAVGTDTLLIRDSLRSLGYKSNIFFEDHGDPAQAQPLRALQPELNREGVAILFHFSIASEFVPQFVGIRNPKIVRYHNITPPEFFSAPEEQSIRLACSLGRQQLPILSHFADFVIADSAYNANEFLTLSKVATSVVPVFRDYEALLQVESVESVSRIFEKGLKPIVLYVGRICRNKAQHDLLKLIAAYKHTFQEPLGLILVGSFFSNTYRNEIEALADHLELSFSSDLNEIPAKDVIITGSVSDAVLATLYRKTSVYCSMSEHEGFGVPLIESQFFDLPVMAHAAAAVPEIIGNNSILFDKSDLENTLLQLRKLVHSNPSREENSASRQWLRSRYGLQALRDALATALNEYRLAPHTSYQ
jgi:glycosyltransferase involved in cell wall biosynthesis